MDKYTIIANYIRNSKKLRNDVVDENTRLNIENKKLLEKITELTSTLAAKEEQGTNSKISAGMIGAVLGYGAGKI